MKNYIYTENWFSPDGLEVLNDSYRKVVKRTK